LATWRRKSTHWPGVLGVNELVSQLTTRTDPLSWFSQAFRSETAQYSLYCFPFAGGSAAYYAEWAKHFAGPIELVPVQLPGRGPRLMEPPASSIASVADVIAALIAEAPKRPLLFGHSMGAIIAFEVARHLQEFRRPAEHLFVSGRPAPPIARPLSTVSTLPRDELVEVLREYGSAEEEVLAHDELLDLLIPMIRADFAMIEQYAYQPAPRLRCPIQAWCGAHDPEVKPEAMHGWGDQTTGGFELFVRPGGHFFLTDHRAEIMRTIHTAAERLGE
jgi:medium-chain acyl-[acyl-carrier-protein] hydrolase